MQHKSSNSGPPRLLSTLYQFDQVHLCKYVSWEGGLIVEY